MLKIVLDYIRKTIRFLLAGIISLIVLSGIMLFYDYSGVHSPNPTHATDHRWMQDQLNSTMVEGFAWIKMDEYGFNNTYKKKDTIDILLMGSSHMEAINVASDENTGYLLNEMLSDYQVYNIGISAHTILHNMNNIEDAVDYYRPTKYVVMETDNIFLDEEKMQEVCEGRFEGNKSYGGGVMFLLQKWLPSTKNIFKAIRNWINVSYDKNEEINTISVIYEENLEAFLEIGSNVCKEHGVKLIIFFKPKTVLDQDGNLTNNTNIYALDIFRKTCNEQDIMFIDMTDSFYQLYREEYKLAHGFFNTGIGVGHLNKYGHRVVANVLGEVILTSDMED